LAALAGILIGIVPLHAQVVTEWVENRSSPQANEIALGYPVPIPVDTPLPFDGFRTYAGLHMRHQDLAASTPWVHPEQIGLTRSGRTIWAYRLGDDDLLTNDGLPEAATLTNGGIHAREWQTPEVVTGILELLALHENDNHFYDYLRDNVNMIVIPSLNIDGFMQTQRYPTLSYMQSDPENPDYSPRDGRMRRKNMLSADEDFSTTADHLNGVDLNRNNNPFWASNPNRSSPNLNSIVHHGSGPASEPEIQALDAAAHLGPIERLRMYTDVHSFSLVHFWVRNNNTRLARETEKVLGTFSDHHVEFPAAKWYYFDNRNNAPRNQGIGLTDEYFTFTYQVPSWTLEVEPSNGQTYHQPLPGSGADYGGVSENGHDGFILPESEIRRVREELAQSFAAVYYRQAGPPSIKALRVIDPASTAVVFEAEWDIEDGQNRSLYINQLQPLQLNHSYDFWVAFSKPMRWRADGQAVPFPGQRPGTLTVHTSVLVNDSELNATLESSAWLNLPGGAPDGYMNYEDDAFKFTWSFPDDTQNQGLITDNTQATLELLAYDMTAMITDSNPGTIADWNNGAWSRYENTNGAESDLGGFDSTISFTMTNQTVATPFLLEPGITSSWFDPSHDGEGFLLEMLANNVAVIYWYTYDGTGAQDWYVAVGEVRGNRIVFPDLFSVSGGEFGPGFDPEKITEESVGSASFIWSSCDEADMSYQIGPQHGRMQLTRLTSLMGIECGNTQLPPVLEQGLLSGSWYDPSHDGEGFNLEVLANGQAVVYWFSFDPEGNRRWFFGIGDIREGILVFNNMMTTHGGIFGPEFNPDAVQIESWGSLQLDLDCQGGTARYDSTEAGFGSGTLNLDRLTNIDLLGCPQ
jgi:hypothetical protein